MADDKRGREKQARDADQRQRYRDVAAELERSDETEPLVDDPTLDTLDGSLDALAFPASGAAVVQAVGDQAVPSPEGAHVVASLVPQTDAPVFESETDLRSRLRRPRVAAAMKELTEACADTQGVTLTGSQREAYEKTVRALQAVDATDEDEPIQRIADWIVARITENGNLPASRAVRREAARICREEGYEIRNDEWLGI